MPEDSPAHAPFAPRTHLEWAFGAWAFVLLTLSFVEGPSSLDPGDIDSSWLHAVAFAASRGMSFGDEVVFTYGPLGWLLFPHDVPSFRTALLLGNVVFGAGFAALAIVTARRMPTRMASFVFLGVYFYFTIVARESLFLLAPLMVTLHALAVRPVRPRAYAAAVVVYSVLACVKLSFLLLSLPCLIALALQAHRAARPRLALFVVLGTPLCLTAVWGLLGQSAAGLYGYLRYGAELVLGHAAAMGVPAEDGTWLAWLSGACALGLLLLAVRAASMREAGRSTAIALLGTAFLIYKNAFVRADTHRLSFFASAVFFAALLPAPRWRRWRAPIVLLRVATATISAYAFVGVWSIQMPASHLRAGWGTRLAGVAQWVGEPDVYGRELDARRAHHASGFELPAIRRRVRGRGVDHLPSTIGVVFANGLSWQPRPVFDGRLAYRGALYDLNLAHFEGTRAPPFLTVGAWPADDEFLPSSIGAAGLRAALEGYRPILSERGVLLMALRDRPLELAADAPPTESQIGFGEEMDVAALREELVWLTADLEPSFVGRIRSAALRPAPASIVLTLDDGRTVRFRVAPGVLARPILLSPFLDGQSEVASIFEPVEGEGGLPAVRTVRFETAFPAMFQDEIAVRVRRASVRERLTIHEALPRPQEDTGHVALYRPQSDPSCMGTDAVLTAARPLVASVPGPSRLSTVYGACPADWGLPRTAGLSLELGDGRHHVLTMARDVRATPATLHAAVFEPHGQRVSLRGHLAPEEGVLHAPAFEIEPIAAWDPAWGARPRLVVAQFPSSPVECGGVPGMSLHARGDVFFHAAPGRRRVTGHAGVCSGNESHGLTLLLGVDGPAGFRIAWGRTLSAEAARAAPRFDIDAEVEVGPEDTVVLRAEPDGDSDGDWAWFGGFAIE